MRQTRDDMIRIREDDLGLDGIVTAAVEKCNSFGIVHVFKKASSKKTIQTH
jgi:hypothetical protein